MTCERWEREIALLAGGELPEGRAEAVRAHVAGCERCREVLAQYEGDRRLLAKARGEVGGTDEAFAAALAERMTEIHGHRVLGRIGWKGVVFRAAAVVLAAAGAVLISRHWQEPTTKPVEKTIETVETVVQNDVPKTTTGYVARRVEGPYLYRLSFPVEHAGAEFTDTGRVKQSGSQWYVSRVVYEDAYGDSY